MAALDLAPCAGAEVGAIAQRADAREEEAEEEACAFPPCPFIVQCAGCFHVLQVHTASPALAQENAVEQSCAAEHSGFACTHVEPDFGIGSLSGLIDQQSDNPAVVPPHAGAQEGEFAENGGVDQSQIEREQSAQRAAAQGCVARPAPRAPVAVYPGFDFVDQHLPVAIGFAAAVVDAVVRGRVFVDAFAARVANGHHDQGFDDACVYECP